jgi:hypothetical protein
MIGNKKPQTAQEWMQYCEYEAFKSYGYSDKEIFARLKKEQK